MRWNLALICSLAFGSAVLAADEPKGEKVEYTVHSGHFEKNNSGLKGDTSYMLITNRADFDAVFGAGFVMGKPPKVVGKDDFDKKVVAAVIRRGAAVTTYKVEKVTVADDTLYVQFEATTGPPGTATFASPLIISTDKAKIAKVVFLEAGAKPVTASAK